MRTRHKVTLEIIVDDPLDLVEDSGDPDNYLKNPKEEIDTAIENAFEEVFIDGVTINFESIKLLKEVEDEV